MQSSAGTGAAPVYGPAEAPAADAAGTAEGRAQVGAAIDRVGRLIRRLDQCGGERERSPLETIARQCFRCLSIGFEQNAPTSNTAAGQTQGLEALTQWECLFTQVLAETRRDDPTSGE